MSSIDRALSGAKHIIQYCLGLAKGQELIILADETTLSVVMVIAEAAYMLGVPHTIMLVPTAQQRRIPAETDLSLLTSGAVKEARAILTCITAEPDSLPFRDRILETHWSAHTRIGHMPGASLEVLQAANVDIDQLVADCHHLEIAMARGQTLELVSETTDRNQHTLWVNLGRWGRLPVASNGIINDGTWGNVPSGETYIAPIEGSATGSIVINGSIPGLVVQPDDEIVLHFVRGCVVSIEPAESPAARWLYRTQIAVAEAKNDLDWTNLAEIGIGVNVAVSELTGNMLFDEKAAGTAHVALGSNTFMGGMVNGVIHCDMVVKRPTIRIDGKLVIDGGELRFNEADWRENYQHVALADSPIRHATMVARSGVPTHALHDGRLERVLLPEPGRVSHCLIGDDQTAMLAYLLERSLPINGDWEEIHKIVESSSFDLEVVQRLLHIMWSYGLIKIYPKG